jgi:hypothetical protein
VATSDQPTGHSRRALLGRGSFLAGVLGLGAGAGATTLVASGSSVTGAADRVQLFGRNWLLQTADRKPGERLVPGERGTVQGELLDAGGAVVGQFYGSRMAMQSDRGGSPVADASMELHTFRLADGTILGMGSTLGGESIFTVTGGTGRYAGKRGTYVSHQRLRELGGDGTAEFTIDLTA